MPKDGYISKGYKNGSNKRSHANTTEVYQLTKTNENSKKDYHQSCSMCSENNRFFKCPKYKELKPFHKFQFVKRKKLCYNFLKKDRFTKTFTSRNKCFKENCLSIILPCTSTSHRKENKPQMK